MAIMKKIISLIFSAIILTTSAIFISGCGCDNKEISSPEPQADIVGDWGGRSDNVEVEFNDDGTCKIGGVNGTYEIDDDKTLTVIPKSDKNDNSSNSTKPMVFEYYSSDNVSSIPSNQWTISNGTLYINGYQYKKENNSSVTSDIENSETQSNINNNSSSSKSSSSNNSTNSQASSNNTGISSSVNNSSSSSQASSGSNSPSSSVDNNFSSSSSSFENSSSNSSNSSTSERQEDNMVTIYENLDNF